MKGQKKEEERGRKDTNLSLSRDLSSSMRLRRSSSRCSRKRCAAMACCLSSSNFRCRSSFCLSRTSFALSTSFALPVDSRPENNHQRSIIMSRLVRAPRSAWDTLRSTFEILYFPDSKASFEQFDLTSPR